MTSRQAAFIEATDDDAPIGHVLSRREMLALVGATGLVACAPSTLSDASSTASGAPATAAPSSSTTPAAAASTGVSVEVPSCIVRPAVTEGPYFVDEKLNRSDVRSDPSNGAVKPGAELALTFNVSRVASAACVAVANAQVDIWHCDALGVYSDASDPSFNTKGQKFLRGFQLTDVNGRASFATIYPGWYQGRAVHIHFKIRTTAGNGTVSDFTSQLFFDDALNTQVFATPPYSQKGTGWMKNAQDGIYTGGGGKLLLKPAVGPSGSSFAATFDIGLA